MVAYYTKAWWSGDSWTKLCCLDFSTNLRTTFRFNSVGCPSCWNYVSPAYSVPYTQSYRSYTLIGQFYGFARAGYTEFDCLKTYEHFTTTTPFPNNGNLRYIIGDPEMNLLFINLKDVFPPNYRAQTYLTPTIDVNANWPTILVSSLKIKITSNQITIKLDYPADEIY